MTAINRAALYLYFKTGDKPTQSQFANLIDSSLNLIDTSAQSIISDVSALGTLTVTGTITGLNTTTAESFIPSGTTVPQNGLYLDSANVPGLSANNKLVVNFQNVGTAVNNFSMANAPTGVAPTFAVLGSDSNIQMTLLAKGTSGFVFANNTGVAQVAISGPPLAVNLVTIKGAIAGDSPNIVASGADTDISITLIPKGAGNFVCGAINGNTTGGAANVNVDSSGNLKKSTSSLRYKRDVIDYDKGLAHVMQMRPVYYKSNAKNDGDFQYAGLIAEEIDALGLKEFVSYQDGKPDGLAYGNMVAILVAAVKELQARIVALESKS